MNHLEGEKRTEGAKADAGGGHGADKSRGLINSIFPFPPLGQEGKGVEVEKGNHAAPVYAEKGKYGAMSDRSLAFKRTIDSKFDIASF
jgi:hypothetical protein